MAKWWWDCLLRKWKKRTQAALKQVCRTFCFPELHEEQPEAIGGRMSWNLFSLDTVNRLYFRQYPWTHHLFRKTLLHVHGITTSGTDGKSGAVSRQPAKVLSESIQKPRVINDQNMWTDCYYTKRTLTKFLGVDKHTILGDPIRGNDDICNNNYLVLYDVVSDVESDVLDKTDRTGYLCERQRCLELSKSAFCVQQIDASKEIKYRIENRSRYVMFINYNNHSCFKCKYHEWKRVHCEPSRIPIKN